MTPPYHHHPEINTVIILLNKILALVQGLTKEVSKFMVTLDQVVSDVSDESTVVDSLVALTAGIKAQLDAALLGVLTPGDQAKVDAIFAAVEAEKAKVAAAITANTPATPAA